MKKINLILTIFVTALALSNIVASAVLSSSGESLRELESQSYELKHQNQLLEQQLVTSRSLTKLSQDSQKLGFTDRPEIVTLSPEEAVAIGY